MAEDLADPDLAPGDDAVVEPSAAVLYFAGAWLVGVFAASIVTAVLHSDPDADVPIGVLAASLVVLWSCYLVGMWLASRRAGTGRPAADYGIRFAPVDVAGVAIGAASQLVLVPVVYAPLRAIWPDTFSDERLEETARDLVDRADGGLLVVLFLLVVAGAPIVEELFYRGLLQRSLLGAFRPRLVIPGVAAVFALVHFRPLEFPGLFAFGLVLGVCQWTTGRLGLPIVAHVAFNATGLVLVV